MKKIASDNRGVAALLSVVIIGAIVLIMTKNSADLGRADLDIVNDSIQSGIALSNAKSCAEEALAQIRHNVNFEFNSLDLNFDNGSCTLSVQKIDDSFEIQSEGRNMSYLKKLRLNARFEGEEIVVENQRSE